MKRSAAGDIPFVLERIAPEVEWIETRRSASPPTVGSRHRRRSWRTSSTKIPEVFETFELRPELWIEKDDDVVVTGRVVARTHAGRDLDAPYAHVFSLRDGHATRNGNFHDTALWAEALTHDEFQTASS